MLFRSAAPTSGRSPENALTVIAAALTLLCSGFDPHVRRRRYGVRDSTRRDDLRQQSKPTIDLVYFESCIAKDEAGAALGTKLRPFGVQR